MTRPDPVASAAPRHRFRRHRARALGAAAVLLAPLGVVGWLLGSPQGLATVRLADVGVAWWAVAAAWLLVLAALGLGPRARRPAGEPG